MQPVVIYATSSASRAPLITFAAAVVIFILMTLAYRFWRVSGRLPLTLVLLGICAAAAGCALWLRSQRPTDSVAVYPDRIVTADGAIPLIAITSIRIQAESSTAYISGRPVPQVRRKLIVETTSGPKTIAADDRYDVDKLLSIIEANRSALH